MTAEDINLLAEEVANWVSSTNGRNDIIKRIAKQTVDTESAYFKKLSGLGWEHKLIETSFVNLCDVIERYSKKNPVPENIKFMLTLMKI